ncbi:AAA family ATPase [Cellulomonas dongxiuzhuiae]|uniref:AAA family ATPase n=1 Tax=Cellulomonas dongxiuzhuiae TaxID=2819979 RepID=UPI001AAEBA90|nr:AAA family ATPase [Cellulomonas dongxiuzhuiae]MBO3086798.1 AAA family ATPase [Cellulomonas dongxiuzhuiae]
MHPDPTRDDIAALVAARTPIVVLETEDEADAVELVLRAASRSPGGHAGRPVFRWTVTDGLRRMDVDLGGAQLHNADPPTLLRSIVDGMAPAVYVLLDLHPWFDDPVVVRLLKDAALRPVGLRSTLVLVSHALTLPREVEHLAVRVPVSFPAPAERAVIVDRTVAAWGNVTGLFPQVDPQARELLVQRLAGLSRSDVGRLAHGAIVDDGALTVRDVPVVERARFEALAADGVLSYEYATVAPADVVGLDRVVRWLLLRRPAMDGSAPHLDAPRGVLLLGVQGCGKSLAARAAASILGVPLLRLDLAGVHDKYVGESERRLRDALAAADALAPCVLWVDEIEKAVASSDSDGGSARRVLGTLLTWLADRGSRVFVAATANDISALPPELVRKGRFDELFFVDLPDEQARSGLLRLHAARRGLTLHDDETGHLVAASDGFSGAEVEQAVVAATYAAHAHGRALDAATVLDELRATRPLAVVMAERVAALRAWAATRTVPAR